MKEYKVVREVESSQPTWPGPGPWAGENARIRVEQTLNALAQDGWVVKSFQAIPAMTGPQFGFRPSSIAYFVLLERDRPEPRPG